MADPFAYLGQGVVAPLRRDGKDDFEHAEGVAVVESTLMLILGTLRAGPTNTGEVPFNMNLGSLLKLLRHRNVDDVETEELAKFYSVDSVVKNEPRIRAKKFSYTPDAENNRVKIKLIWDLVERSTSGIQVIATDIETEVEV
jgi:hypothetical protein